jgi:hypothetical protein
MIIFKDLKAVSKGANFLDTAALEAGIAAAPRSGRGHEAARSIADSPAAAQNFYLNCNSASINFFISSSVL